jgi:hypothetical protein
LPWAFSPVRIVKPGPKKAQFLGNYENGLTLSS